MSPDGLVRDGVFFDVEAYFGFRWSRRRGHELADGLEQRADRSVVAFNAFFEIGEFGSEFFMKGERFS